MGSHYNQMGLYLDRSVKNIAWEDGKVVVTYDNDFRLILWADAAAQIADLIEKGCVPVAK